MRRNVVLLATTITACSGGGACGTPAGPSPSAPAASVEANNARHAEATDAASAIGDHVGDTPAPATPLGRPRTENDDGAKVTVTVGQELVVVLPSNPTTGFMWSVTTAPAELGTPKSEILPPSSGADGAPTRQRFTWVPRAALPSGEHPLVLEYKRSFEQGTPALKTFRLSLRSSS